MGRAALPFAVVIVCLVGLFSTRFVNEATGGRFYALQDFIKGDMERDSSGAARTEGRRALFDAASKDYPLGTLVSPSYIYPWASDSGYLQTAIQGTLAYASSYVLALLTLVAAGWRRYRSASPGAGGAAGLALVGIAGSALVASAGAQPFLSPEFAALVWFQFGICTLSSGPGTRRILVQGTPASIRLAGVPVYAARLVSSRVK